MAYTIRRAFARYIGMMALAALISGACLSRALAQEQILLPGDAPALSSLPPGEPLTDFETMELHYRRYTAAANSMAQLLQQLNQKIQEVSLAAKTVDAKSSSHNRRMLEDKLRQLENTRTSASRQYAQLQSQMQNEYRSYTALSNDLKVKFDTLKDSKTGEKGTTEPETKPSKGKDGKAGDSKAK